MTKYISICCLLFIFISCDWAKEKTKNTVNKSGEIVAKTGSEFVDGVSKGVEKTFENDVVVSEELKKAGLKTGKIVVNNSDSAQNNVITAYLIFDKKFNQNVIIKILNEDNNEYGRSNQIITAGKNEAKYFDFGFDKRTQIEGKGKLLFETAEL